MKKHLSILIACSILFNACTTGRVHTISQPPTSTAQTQTIKHRITKREGDKKRSELSLFRSYQYSSIESQLRIPMEFSDNKKDLPKLPESLQDNRRLWKNQCTMQPSEGLTCELRPATLEIVLEYSKKDARGTGCTGAVVDVLGSPIYAFFPLLFVPFDLFVCVRQAKITPLFSNATVSFQPYTTRGISVSYKLTPSKINLNCDSKQCSLVDENSRMIDKVKIEKIYKVDTKEIAKMLKEEAQARKEKQRKEREEKLRQQRAAANTRKYCPKLYDIFYVTGGQYTLDPITKAKIIKDWDQFDCNQWIDGEFRKVEVEVSKLKGGLEECPSLYNILYAKGGQYTLDPITKTRVLLQWQHFNCSLWLNEQMR